MVAAPVRVFVVDDDADTTDCMALLLKHHGLEVRVANRGQLSKRPSSSLT